MSDVEEPAAKVAKLDDMAEGEEMEDGQEEWLSEEILTDDDYNPATEQDQSDSIANMSQEEGNTDSMDQTTQDPPSTTGENIELTLNSLENATPSIQAELPEELGAFLIRKTDKRVVDDQQPSKEPESELDESTKQSEDDGNDTDDLLRMLGEDNSKKKEVTGSQSSQSMQAKDTAHSSDDDDDEYIFEGAKVTRLTVSKDVLRNKENNVRKLIVAKGALIQKPRASRALPEDTSDREADNHVSTKISALSKFKAVKVDRDGRGQRIPTRAVPEDLSDPDDGSGQSSDEAVTVKRMFDMQSKTMSTGPRGLPTRRKGINAVKTVTKRVISIEPKNGTNVISSATLKSSPKSISKPLMMLQTKSRHPAPLGDPRDDMDRIVSHNEVFDDDQSNDMESEVEEEGGQRLMRPERMDEEVPSDAESHTDDDSYYDEMPSSDSEDADDWFTLDIRGERAADYIPMLGEDAKALLTAEQQRAAARLGALKRSAGALVAGRRSLAAQLRMSRSSLAQLDAALAQ